MIRPSLSIRFQRISPTHQKIAYVRRDTSSEEMVVETKSFLGHDFLHFALETETECLNGFYGLFSRGYSCGQLAGKEPAALPSGEVQTIERVAGVLSSVVKGTVSPAQALAGLENIFQAYNQTIPPWLTLDLICRTTDRFRKILGQWNSLRYGEVLELSFDPQNSQS